VKKIILSIALTSALLITGCITTAQSYEETHDPMNMNEVESQLKTEKDWEQWEKLQEHNRNAILIIGD